MNDVSVQQLEQQRKDAEMLIERRNAAIRLSSNADFKRLFLDEYFTKEAARMVQLGGDPALSKEQREDALQMAMATGHTKRFLSVIVQQGAKAESEMDDLDEMIREAEAEAEQAEMEENEGSIQ